MLDITKHQARNYLLNRSFFHQKAKSLHEVLEFYSCIQVDPINAVARTHEMSLWNRVDDFKISDLYTELYEKYSLFEHWLELYSIIPTKFYPYLSARRSVQNDWQDEYRKSHKEEIRLALKYITDHGPTSPKDLADVAQSKERLYAWKEGGLRTALLQFLWDTGQVMITHRASNQKYYDLTERVLPAEILSKQVSEKDSIEFILKSSFDYVGILSMPYIARSGVVMRSKARELFKQKLTKGEIVQLRIPDVKTKYYIWHTEVEKIQHSKESFHNGLNILPPLDPLIIDRQLLLDVFGYYYRWEVYTTPKLRKFGYYNMPILYKSEVVGQIELKKEKNLQLNINKLETNTNSSEFRSVLDNHVQGLQEFISKK